MQSRWLPTKIIVTALLLLIPGCGGEHAPQPLSLDVQSLPAPTGEESLAPRLAIGADGRVVLSWLERAGNGGYALRFARLDESGWSSPEEIARGNDWFVNWADTPGVQPLADGGLMAFWLQKSGGSTYAYDVVMKHRTRAGTEWSEVFSPHHDDTRTEHGFVSILPEANGGFGMLWLDGRNTVDGGGMTLRYAAFDVAGKQRSASEIDTLTCDCCPTDAALSADGWVAAYRNRTEEEIRDIYVTRLTADGWSKPQPIHADNWHIAGCPVNGPAVAADGKQIAVAWFTAANELPRVWLAQSVDGGRTFGATVRIDEGAPLGRVELVFHPQYGLLIGWLEKAQAGASFRLRAVDADGGISQSTTITVLSAQRRSGFPVLVPYDGVVVAAWTAADNDRRVVKTARLVIGR